MNNVKVIDNTGGKFNVVMNDDGNGLVIVINLANQFYRISRNLKPGDVFKDNDGDEWILWFWTEDGNAAILKKEILCNMNFGKDNNYDGCYVDKYLTDTYLKEMERKFGAENIVEHDVDLTSLDGEDDYGVIRRKLSIPTFDIYKKYKKIIKKFLGKIFLLATANSTPSGDGSHFVHYVDSYGRFSYDWYDYENGVRPFAIVKPSNL